MEFSEESLVLPSPLEFPPTITLKSTIEGAGQGLFAAENLAPNQLIIEYTGKILNYRQAKILADRTYLKSVTFNRHIDGSTGGPAKFVNDCADKTRINCRFRKWKKKRVFLQALRAISQGEELFVDYGRSHWLFSDALEFLGLRYGEQGGVFTTKKLDANQVVSVFESPALDPPKCVGRQIRVAGPGEDFNVVLHDNPFMEATTMVNVLDEGISVHSELVLPAWSAVRLTKAGDIVARQDIAPGQFLGDIQEPSPFASASLSLLKATANISVEGLALVASRAILQGSELII